MLINARDFRTAEHTLVEPYFIQTDSTGKILCICQRLSQLLAKCGASVEEDDRLFELFSSLSNDKLPFHQEIPSFFEINFDKIPFSPLRLRWMSSPLHEKGKRKSWQLTGMPLGTTGKYLPQETESNFPSSYDEAKCLPQVVAAKMNKGENPLDSYSSRLNNLFDGICEGFFALDSVFTILYCNKEAGRMLDLPAGEWNGLNLLDLVPDTVIKSFTAAFSRTLQDKVNLSFVQYIRKKGSWIELNVYPSGKELFICSKDITAKKRQEMLLALERRVLEINSSPKATLQITFDYFLLGIEEIFPDMICSVLLLGENKKTMVHLSAPSLPVEYCEKINGMDIGDGAGSCGTAMYLKRYVITENISTDPLWAPYRELPLAYNLHACWSYPLLTAEGEALGSFATYYKYPRKPSPEEWSTIDQVANLARIIIENKIAADHIRLSNERYQLATKATNDVIWDWDMQTNEIIWSEAFYTHYGNERSGHFNLSFFESIIHPQDHDRVMTGIAEFIEQKNSELWSNEFRIKKADGKYAMVNNRSFLVCDPDNKPRRLIGSMQDITEQRKLEQKILKQELDKQKSVTHAVIEAQEKERTELGKELQDNVNQILSTGKLYLEMAKTNEQERLQLIELSTENIMNSINEIQNITKALLPAMVIDLGLTYTINDLIGNLKLAHGINVEFYTEGNFEDNLPEGQKLMLFRIVQEQVKNVIGHAEAKNLIIEMFVSADDKQIELNISDDGKGFDPDTVKKGLGFSNIMCRVDFLEGELKIVSRPGEGCKIRILIPIKPL